MSAKMRGTEQVAVCFFGEGALGQGLLYEAMNMAALWKLPVIYVCENNHYSEYTPYQETCAGDIPARAAAFGIPGDEVDGQDVLAVYEAASRLVGAARVGAGPQFLLSNTYRYRGHHVGDIDRRYYRSRDEEDEWQRERDPIVRLSEWLIGQELVEREVLDRIQEEVGTEIEGAAQFALDAPLPEPAEVTRHVYVEASGSGPSVDSSSPARSS
jgi:pyruvate dehydrogenase E1 component alpha subunit